MNRDRHPTRSKQSVQRLDRTRRPQRTPPEDGEHARTTAFRDTDDTVTPLDDVDADAYDEPWPTRLPSSARRYDAQTWQQGNTRVVAHPRAVQPIPRRTSAYQQPLAIEEEVPVAQPQRRRRRGQRAHPLLYLGTGMLAMLALWVLLQWAVSWWQLHRDDVTYGRPRTYQLDAVFGHNDSAANPTHIIIVNLNRHLIVMELPGGDASHARIYSGPTLFGDGQELQPVTGRALDGNGDGKLDLVLYVQDQRIVFINDGTQFRPLKPGEHVTIPPQ
jgi:hypothetical protein